MSAGDPHARAEVKRFPSADALMEAAAEVFARCAREATRASGRFSVALSGGSTPAGLYDALAAEPCAARVDWRHVHVFWADERCVPPDAPASNYRMVRQHLLDRVPVPAPNVHRMRGEDDPVEAAATYEQTLRSAFGTPDGPPRTALGSRFDLVLLGMGNDGHVASLFPGKTDAAERERWVVARRIESPAMWRVSLTPLVINAAAEVVFLVAGREKATALRRVLRGPHQPDSLPAQAIAPGHGRLLWLVDAAAAAELGSEEEDVHNAPFDDSDGRKS
jgi:6-phosphogluconolactonase